MNKEARAAILAALNHKTEYRHQLAADQMIQGGKPHEQRGLWFGQAD